MLTIASYPSHTRRHEVICKPNLLFLAGSCEAQATSHPRLDGLTNNGLVCLSNRHRLESLVKHRSVSLPGQDQACLRGHAYKAPYRSLLEAAVDVPTIVHLLWQAFYQTNNATSSSGTTLHHIQFAV